MFRPPLSLLAAVVCAGWLTSCQTGQTMRYTPPPAGSSYQGGVVLGIDRLAGDGFALLRGRRVGLICNQTSVNRSGTPTRVVLQRALGGNLTSLYAPEHGIDGRVGAGVSISGSRDRLTGLPVYSLYGDTRKPTPAMLANIDVMVFDLQDIGSRSYTYISTMVVAMEACGQARKDFVVLDRPNPLGGVRVNGPPLERSWKSFVGQVPVPYVHGMTAGELAQMTNAMGWNSSRCRLTVVPMLGWQRYMSWGHTGLGWVPTSPNIPKTTSPIYYAATGVLGGASGVDVGIGTGAAFEYAGAQGINANEFTSAISRLGWPGVSFSPYSHDGFSGCRIAISPNSPADLITLDVALLYELNRRKNGAIVNGMHGDELNLFHKVYGSASLYNALRRGQHPGQITQGWASQHASFRAARQPYLLY